MRFIQRVSDESGYVVSIESEYYDWTDGGKWLFVLKPFSEEQSQNQGYVVGQFVYPSVGIYMHKGKISVRLIKPGDTIKTAQEIVLYTFTGKEDRP